MKHSNGYKVIYLFYCLILFIALDLNGQNLSSKLDSIVSEFVEDPNGPGYSILVTKKGETLYRNNVGYSDVKNKIRIESDQIFQIGSMTKQFTALGILRLVDRGLITLDDDIKKYIPSFSGSKSVITIHHLLAHTSGLANHSNMPAFDKRFSNTNSIEPPLIINEFINEDVEFSSGEKVSYNNFGYVILGHIIEEVSQLSYKDYLNQEFFMPLNLQNTNYLSARQDTESYVTGYNKVDQNFSIADLVNPSLAFSAGGMTSSVEDFTKWYSYVNNLKQSNDPMITLALSPKTTDQNLTTGYGYGWQIGTFRGRNYYGHDGIIGGFNCDARFFEEDQIFIAVFSNIKGYGSTRLLKSISDALMHTHINADISIDEAKYSVEKLSGRYQLRPGFVIDISTTNNKIYGSPNGQSAVELQPIGKNKFYVREIEAEIKFETNAEGIYNSFTLVQGGQSNIALRMEE